MLNNSRELEKESLESSENCISSLTFEIFNSIKSTLKTTSKRLYNLKSSSSKFDKWTRSIKEFENWLNYKDFHREHLTKFKEKTHMYNVFRALLWAITQIF